MYDVIKFRVAITEKKVPALIVAKTAPAVGADAWMLSLIHIYILSDSRFQQFGLCWYWFRLFLNQKKQWDFSGLCYRLRHGNDYVGVVLDDGELRFGVLNHAAGVFARYEVERERFLSLIHISPRPRRKRRRRKQRQEKPQRNKGNKMKRIKIWEF